LRYVRTRKIWVFLTYKHPNTSTVFAFIIKTLSRFSCAASVPNCCPGKPSRLSVVGARDARPGPAGPDPDRSAGAGLA
ncbi:hypothetical protein ABLN72_14840, partial [Mycobacterium tuberculosis]